MAEHSAVRPGTARQASRFTSELNDRYNRIGDDAHATVSPCARVRAYECVCIVVSKSISICRNNQR